MKKIILLPLFLFAAGICFCIENVDFPTFDTKEELTEDLFFGIPQETDIMLVRSGFSVGYNIRYRQAVWICYILYADNLEKPQVRRSNKFKADPKILIGAVQPRDYTRTGFDKGHLAPAADMTYSNKTMENSFLMTNISPQRPSFNRGIWKRLEKQVRQWAKQEDMLCVITGPLFDRKPKEKLGKTDIPVPYAFYKVILDMTPPMKMIGFLIPNQTTKRRLSRFVVTVNDLERMTGFDFFSNLPDDLEERLESDADFASWSVPGNASEE